MRHPNRRYGNPTEFLFYAGSIPVADLARRLRRSERTIRNWLHGREKLPWWVPEIMRLQNMEHTERMRQMGFLAQETRLGVVKGAVLEFRPPQLEKKPQEPLPAPEALFSLRQSG
jgi:hypothetical protein